ncbi:hypothetical protein [Streptomyces sp. NPDC052496]
MSSQEQAAKDAAEAARQAVKARQEAEAKLRRHGQARAGVGGRR